MTRTTSPAGVRLIQEFEGLRLNPYLCPAGVLTVGYGHTGADVVAGKAITPAEAEALLRADLGRFERAVSRLVLVPLNQDQFDALVSFAFNLGEGALASSTLLRMLNAGDYAGAAAQFGRWTLANGASLPGLVRRRAAERALFLTPQIEVSPAEEGTAKDVIEPTPPPPPPKPPRWSWTQLLEKLKLVLSFLGLGAVFGTDGIDPAAIPAAHGVFNTIASHVGGPKALIAIIVCAVIGLSLASYIRTRRKIANGEHVVAPLMKAKP